MDSFQQPHTRIMVPIWSPQPSVNDAINDIPDEGMSLASYQVPNHAWNNNPPSVSSVNTTLPNMDLPNQIINRAHNHNGTRVLIDPVLLELDQEMLPKKYRFEPIEYSTSAALVCLRATNNAQKAEQ